MLFILAKWMHFFFDSGYGILLAMDDTSLLQTKLYLPPLYSEVVARPRLVERLTEAVRAQHKLILISAPAGFGKTTLVSSWLHKNTQVRDQNDESLTLPSKVAWFSLDEADSDPRCFLIYLIAALRQIDPEVGQTAQHMLQSPQALPVQSLMTTLINDIVLASTPFILVLDDYHLGDDPTVHDILTLLLDNLPPTMHLIITCRADPPLALARLRARGQMTELRVDDLRFTLEETTAFLNSVMDLSLAPPDVVALETRTEGWIAGLRLAALSMQGQTDKSKFITAFTGKDRYVVDYLLEEVFQRQPEDIQTFLLQTSILDRLSGSLCEAVTGQNGGQDTLETLEKSNLFILPLDNERRWYRYQQLFVEFLRGRLAQSQGDAASELHLRAAAWFQENGFLEQAINHTLLARDVNRAAILIETAAGTILRVRGQARTLLGWLKAIPDEVIRTRPQLYLCQLTALFFTGQWVGIEERLLDLEKILTDRLPTPVDIEKIPANIKAMLGEIATIRSELALFQESVDRALELSQQALDYVPQENIQLRSMIIQSRGYIFRLNGEVTKASQALTEASTLSQVVENITLGIFALCDLGEVQVMQGQLHQAAKTFQRALDLASEHQAWPFPPTGAAYVGMGNILREWNELEAAGQHLQKGIELSQQGGYTGVSRQGYQTLAQVKQAQGETNLATDFLQKAMAVARQAGPNRHLDRVAPIQARLFLMQGDVEAAAQWSRMYESSPNRSSIVPAYQYFIEQCTLARVRLAQGQPDFSLLEQLLHTAEQAGWQANVIEINILLALALDRRQVNDKAIKALRQALTLAEPEGYVRIFVDEGAPMAKLLRLAVSQKMSPTYVGKLQASFMPSVGESSISAQALIDPLTKRELKVLELMAAGLSNREIADELILALGTVAKYTNNIFTKLNVRNRTQAISQARALEII